MYSASFDLPLELSLFKVTYQGVDLDLTPPWRRATMSDLVKDASGFDFDTLDAIGDPVGALAAAQAAAQAAGVEEKCPTVGNALNNMFEHLCEETLVRVRVLEVFLDHAAELRLNFAQRLEQHV